MRKLQALLQSFAVMSSNKKVFKRMQQWNHISAVKEIVQLK
jgi:hypothetical protein